MARGRNATDVPPVAHNVQRHHSDQRVLCAVQTAADVELLICHVRDGLIRDREPQRHRGEAERRQIKALDSHDLIVAERLVSNVLLNDFDDAE